MRYLSTVIWLAVVVAAAFLAALGLLAAGGWTECNRDDCGAVGESVYWVYRALAWPAVALVVLAGVAVLLALLRSLRSARSS